MGKYRTFSEKVADLNGATVHGDRIYRGSCNGNDQHISCKDFLKPGILPVRSKVEWQKWRGHQRFKGGLYSRQKPSLLLTVALVCCLAYLSQPSSAIPSGDGISLEGKDHQNRFVKNDGILDEAEYSNFPKFAWTWDVWNKSKVKASLNCTRPSSDEFPPDFFTKEQRQNGAVAIHFLATFYILYGLYVVCDKYFVPAVSVICEELHLPHNIAGATLMAISTSAPELFTNVIGTFVTKGDLGVGTIVGSAVFNVLAVGTAVGIGTNIAVKKSQLSPYSKRSKRKGVPLEWWSLTRDSAYYLLSVVVLIAVLADGRVYWQEALVMLLIYGFYITGMCYDAQFRIVAETLVEKMGFSSGRATPRKLSVVIKKAMQAEEERAPLLQSGAPEIGYGTRPSSQWTDVEQSGKSQDSGLYPPLKPFHTKSLSQVSLVGGGVMTVPLDDIESASVSSDDSSSSEESVNSSGAIVRGIKDVVTFPAKFILSWTIPDCKQESRRKWCGLSLLSCIVWIATLSYVTSWMVVIIGETLAIPDTVSGLTFLAAGTSFPEVISSVIVARQGLGSMGLSNSVGSNTFDILICLGLPWLIQSSILTASDVDYIEIHSGGLQYTAISLIVSFLLLYLIIAANGYVLDTKVGVGCLLMYIVFIVFACLLEMNVFFPVNLPPCQ